MQVIARRAEGFERVRKGHVIPRTRPRDVEETLLELINDDDPVVSAAAIAAVREHRVWSLADDLELWLPLAAWAEAAIIGITAAAAAIKRNLRM